VAGIVLASLGVALLVIALIALRSPTGSGTAAGKNTAARSAPKSTPKSSPKSSTKSSPTISTSRPATRTTSSTPAAGKLPLVVLNNTDVNGLATQAKATFEAGGWTVTSTGDLTNNILSTCAYYDPAAPTAQAAAEALRAQFPAIKRVAPRFAELPAGPIVVVLTPDYSG
jgi:hypothetical protein